jgi:hypothetical protein
MQQHMQHIARFTQHPPESAVNDITAAATLATSFVLCDMPHNRTSKPNPAKHTIHDSPLPQLSHVLLPRTAASPSARPQCPSPPSPPPPRSAGPSSQVHTARHPLLSTVHHKHEMTIQATRPPPQCATPSSLCNTPAHPNPMSPLLQLSHLLCHAPQPPPALILLRTPQIPPEYAMPAHHLPNKNQTIIHTSCLTPLAALPLAAASRCCRPPLSARALSPPAAPPAPPGQQQNHPIQHVHVTAVHFAVQRRNPTKPTQQTTSCLTSLAAQPACCCQPPQPPPALSQSAVPPPSSSTSPSRAAAAAATCMQPR